MDMVSVLLFIALIGGCGLMWWGSYKLEPHWVSKDGERLVCYGQGLDKQGRQIGRWREVRVTKIRSDTLEVRPRHGSLVVDRYKGGTAGIAGGVFKHRGQQASYWKVGGAAPSAPRNRAVYLLDGCNDPDLPHMLAIRIPKNSRAIPMLESLSRNKAAITASTSNPETPPAEEQPDRD